MRQQLRTLSVLVVGLTGGFVAQSLAAGDAAPLMVLGAGLVAGELLTLRLEDEPGLPLSYAVVLVLAASFPVAEFAVTVGVALLVAAVVRPHRERVVERARFALHRGAVAAGSFGAFAAMREVVEHRESITRLLVTLGVVCVAQLLVDEGARRVEHVPSALSPRGRLAWLALASSGMLMAIGYRGVDGGGDVGIWGPLLFSVPLLATWYSFERLHAISRTQRQTIEALSVAPELAGIVPTGHAARVAMFSSAVAELLGMGPDERRDLTTAALLHHIGQVTLDDPEVLGRPLASSEISSVTGAMLREIEPLAAAGGIIADQHGSLETSPLASKILRVASAFDDLADGDIDRFAGAYEALASAPGYVYDAQVVEALGVVVERLEHSPEALAAV